jgi:hypothetical protein
MAPMYNVVWMVVVLSRRRRGRRGEGKILYALAGEVGVRGGRVDGKAVGSWFASTSSSKLNGRGGGTRPAVVVRGSLELKWKKGAQARSRAESDKSRFHRGSLQYAALGGCCAWTEAVGRLCGYLDTRRSRVL